MPPTSTRTLPVWAALLAAFAIVFALAAPRLVLWSTAIVLGLGLALALLPPAATSGVVDGLKQLLDRQRPLLLASAAVALYLLLTVLWAPDRVNGFGKVLLFAVLVSATAIAAVSYARLSIDRLDQLGRVLLIGLAIGAAFLVFEEATNHAINSALFNAIPALRPDARHLQTDGDIVGGVAAYLSNRNVAMLALLMWPALALVQHVLPKPQVLAVSLLLGIATLVVAALSAHASSRLALTAGIAMYVIARAVPRQAIWVAVAGWLTLTLLMVPIATQLYARGAHLNERVPFSFRARIILWNYTADQIPRHFWRGVGIDGTKPLDAARKKTWETRPDHVYPQRTGEHSHNFYIQLWYELGALGVALFSLFGVAVLFAVNRLTPDIRPFGFAAVMTAAGLGATSWGIWQPWLMGAYGSSAMLMAFAAVRASKQAEESAPAKQQLPEPRAAVTS